jgi:fluoride exporter
MLLLHWLAAGFNQIGQGFALLTPDVRAPIAISLGAIPGALCRYYLTMLAGYLWGSDFPLGTLAINLTGCLVMGGFITYMLTRSPVVPEVRLLVAVGFLGSYTTFSTYSLETATLWHRGQHKLALGYGLGSAALGVVCLELGSWLARRLP